MAQIRFTSAVLVQVLGIFILALSATTDGFPAFPLEDRLDQLTQEFFFFKLFFLFIFKINYV